MCQLIMNDNKGTNEVKSGKNNDKLSCLGIKGVESNKMGRFEKFNDEILKGN